MATTKQVSHPHIGVGDWIEARGLPGWSGRRGQVTEALGNPGHEHYRVRWDEQHESLLFPADGGVALVRHPDP
ncbi:MAG TPA: DUF1918 domain-containing protein [Solirubrobacteraceae bacterium]|nr:DUF1918 domain-containing protein [Solirubrobacteraceae bacterium]